MHSHEFEALIQTASASTQIYLLKPTLDNKVKVDEDLTRVLRESTFDAVARLDTVNTNISQFLQNCSQLLSNDSTSAPTRSRLCLVFYNFSLYNLKIRRFLSGGNLQLCGPIFFCLQRSLSEQLGPQNLIDILRLLQILTYEKCLALGNWTNDLLSFLLPKLTNTNQDQHHGADIDDPLSYYMTILCNLVSRSKMVVAKLKKMNGFKHLCRQLLEFLQNDSRIVVICSLVLIGYLDEKTRDTIFSSQNIAQTFLCIFNVLGTNNSVMTINIAVDLLKRLVISTPAYGRYTLTNTAKNFTSYQFFEKSIQRVANLLILFDPRSEESEKIYDLFLSFCKTNELRQDVCLAILKAPASERRLTTPILSICRTAAMVFEEAIRPEIPLAAQKFLVFLIREAIDNGIKVESLIPVDTICLLVESTVKSEIETKSDFVSFQCWQITEGLRLAEAVANDEDIRRELLNVVDTPLCSHINESQLISNPVVSFMSKLKNSSSTKPFSSDLPSWSLYGAAIPLQLLRLLATLKDYSRIHKELYWRSLKDERIVPFIAFAISRGTDEMVLDALILFTHCAQVHEFQTKLLADLIASCSLEYQAFLKERNYLNPGFSTQNGTSLESLSDFSGFSDGSSTSNESFKQIDELLAKMKDVIDLKDVRTSQLVCAFEKKVAMHENRERELEQMIVAKDHALSQSERLRNMCQERGNSQEITNLRFVLSDMEKKVNECDAKILVLNEEKMELVDRNTRMAQEFEKEKLRLSNELDTLRINNNVLVDENEKERELHAVLRSRFDEMTAKFDIATRTIVDKQRELDHYIKEAAELRKVKKTLEETNVRFANSEKTVEEQCAKIDEQAAEIAKLKDENKKLLKIKQAMAQMLND